MCFRLSALLQVDADGFDPADGADRRDRAAVVAVLREGIAASRIRAAGPFGCGMTSRNHSPKRSESGVTVAMRTVSVSSAKRSL